MASASFPPPPPSSSPAMTPSPASFSHSIPTKLTNSSYILWCNQVQPVIKGHGLSYFLVAPIIPSRFDTVADCNAGIVLKEYLNWEKQDQFLLSWLQSTISNVVLPHLVGCNTSWHLWEKLHAHFYLPPGLPLVANGSSGSMKTLIVQLTNIKSGLLSKAFIKDLGMITMRPSHL